MNRPLTLVSRAEPNMRLRAAGPGDLDRLRVWKNANKPGFFFQGEITPEMQAQWFEGYRARPDDYMFVVERAGAPVGCMGFRREKDGSVDAYNMIVAPEAAGRGYMKAAMALMCSFAADRYTRDIGCLVLKTNPAVAYYQACGYKIVGDGGDHHIFKLDWTRFQPVGYDVAEGTP